MKLKAVSLESLVFRSTPSRPAGTGARTQTTALLPQMAKSYAFVSNGSQLVKTYEMCTNPAVECQHTLHTTPYIRLLLLSVRLNILRYSTDFDAVLSKR